MDSFISKFDKALRSVAGITFAHRASPATFVAPGLLSDAEQRHSAGLMRINHVGEVCAQALYEAQGQFAKNTITKQQFSQAGREEEDHLAWTAERLQQLGSSPSLLNPLWYTGAYVLGAVAACLGDARSLGFVVETERQVEAHLASHLQSLPLEDEKSRAIVGQMRLDEIAHGAKAQAMGATEMPPLLQKGMQAMAKIMTTTAYYI